jgi:hypothetical protein
MRSTSPTVIFVYAGFKRDKKSSQTHWWIQVGLLKEVVISPDSVDRTQELALRPRIDGKFRSIKLVSPSNENASLVQNE